MKNRSQPLCHQGLNDPNLGLTACSALDFIVVPVDGALFAIAVFV